MWEPGAQWHMVLQYVLSRTCGQRGARGNAVELACVGAYGWIQVFDGFWQDVDRYASHTRGAIVP